MERPADAAGHHQRPEVQREDDRRDQEGDERIADPRPPRRPAADHQLRGERPDDDPRDESVLVIEHGRHRQRCPDDDRVRPERQRAEPATEPHDDAGEQRGRDEYACGAEPLADVVDPPERDVPLGRVDDRRPIRRPLRSSPPVTRSGVLREIGRLATGDRHRIHLEVARPVGGERDQGAIR